MPKVSIIIATYNLAATLRCALESVCAQTYRDFEVWVVGDCCTDESEQVVASFGDARLQWTNLPQHVGVQSGPNNEGLRRARGEYIAYLGHDDLWFPWHLERMVETLQEAAADFAHALVAMLHPMREATAVGAGGVRRTYADRFTPPSGWLHKRAILSATGGWPNPDGLVGGVDFVLQRRLFLGGCAFAASERLSVLKFPSPWWRAYAATADRPQPTYLARMLNNPSELEAEVLTGLVLGATRVTESRSIVPAAKGLYQAIRHTALDWYGLDRWPLSQYLAAKQARWRERAKALRGLR